jgi:hypothetical protein
MRLLDTWTRASKEFVRIIVEVDTERLGEVLAGRAVCLDRR